MQYSTKATPQLARITPKSGTALKRRCPYQASVMNTLEPRSNRIGRNCGEVSAGNDGIGGHRGGSDGFLGEETSAARVISRTSGRRREVTEVNWLRCPGTTFTSFVPPSA